MSDIIYSDESYSCVIQELNGRAFFHVDVLSPLSVSDIKRGRAAFSKIKEVVLGMGYDRMYAITPSPHFARLLGKGFSHIKHIEYKDVVQEMIVWELK